MSAHHSSIAEPREQIYENNKIAHTKIELKLETKTKQKTKTDTKKKRIAKVFEILYSRVVVFVVMMVKVFCFRFHTYCFV